MTQFHPIETERLILRPIAMTDADSLYQMGKDEDFANNAGFKVFQSLEDATLMIERNAKRAQEDWRLKILAIELKKTGVMIGTINFPVSPEVGILEIGYLLHPNYWNQGIVTEAVNALTTFAFTVLNSHKLVIQCHDSNIASKKVAKKCGFQKEAHFKQQVLVHNTYVDSVAYGLLKTDWENKPIQYKNQL